MSKNRFRERVQRFMRSACQVLAAASMLHAAVAGASATQSKTKSIEERQLVRSVRWKYAVLQAGETVGSESVTRSDYSDNSVQFRSHVDLEFQGGVSTAIETDMVLEEETFFPISYEMTKHMTQGGVEFTLETRFEWFSNVAVVCKSSRGVPDTLQVILPAGTAVVDMSVAHQMHVPLYWYDADRGGVQNFNVVDPWSTRTYPATLRLQTKETIVVNGKEIDADRYEFVREKQTFKVYVDGEGRVVKLDQGFLVYELSEWSESLGPDK